MAPLLLHMEQSQRLKSSSPLGRVTSNSIVPQWQDPLCTGFISTKVTSIVNIVL